MITGNLITDVTIFVMSVAGFTILVAQEYVDYKDKRRWRKK